MFLKYILPGLNISKTEISNVYSVSCLVLNLIKRYDKHPVIEKQLKNVWKISEYQNINKLIKIWIELIHKMSTTLVEKDIPDYVNSLLNTKYSVDFIIIKFMKSQLNMSF